MVTRQELKSTHDHHLLVWRDIVELKTPQGSKRWVRKWKNQPHCSSAGRDGRVEGEKPPSSHPISLLCAFMVYRLCFETKGERSPEGCGSCLKETGRAERMARASLRPLAPFFFQPDNNQPASFPGPPTPPTPPPRQGPSLSVSVHCSRALTSPPVQAWPLPFCQQSPDCEGQTNRGV